MSLKVVGDPIIKRFANETSKQVTLKLDENNKLLRYQQIRNYCEKLEAKLPDGSKLIVRASGIQRNTTLYSTYANDGVWKSDKEWDDYLRGDVEDPSKFKAFFNFTVTIIKPK